MKRVLLIFLVCFLNCSLFSQTIKDKDSLYHKLAQAKNDSARVNALLGLCQYFLFKNADSNFYYGYKGLSEARKFHLPDQEAWFLFYLSVQNANIGNQVKRYELLLKALKVTRDNNLSLTKGQILAQLGKFYADFDIAAAFKYAYEAKDIFIKNPEYDASLLYTFLSIFHLKTKQLDSAQYYANMLQSLINSRSQTAMGKGALNSQFGDIQMAKKNYDSALYFYRISSRINTGYLYNLSKYFKEIKNYDSAIWYAEASLEPAIRFKEYQDVIDISKSLSELYLVKNNATKVNHYNRLTIDYQDSLILIRNAATFKAISEYDQKETAYEVDLAETALRNKIKIIGLLVGLVIALIIGIIIYSNYQTQKKANDLLEQQKLEIKLEKAKSDEALEKLKTTQSQLIQAEKMASLGELTAGIAHEIQNPLNFVNNFSEVCIELLQEMKEELDKGNTEDAKDIATDVIQNLDKITYHGKRADSIVKGMLQHSRSGTRQKELTDINELCDEYLRLAYHGLRAKDKSFNANFEMNADSTIPKLKLVQQDIGRVILNLISNAFYAVNERKKQASTDYTPSVTVSTRSEKNGVAIIVEDNGAGIPKSVQQKIFQPFFTTKPAGQGTGLGLSLSYDIIKAHGGSIDMESKEGEGTRFFIYLPTS
ncbi:MAG: ATP-binding protein [Sediminibacterium sp.]|jgi:two-component system, NtrC family, sensor kinase|uniref:sensor histidine kinase n=1 Tax=Sediminibacterium sp. TaxID=1917865 RepID=UPI002ABA6C53|nr:ATP-binding protein [Sediminibacterium sp.]MDZ4070478.1 ATP-binding protein [Sediminibacterium sp.]